METRMLPEKPQDQGAAIGLPEAWLHSTQDVQRIMCGGVNLDGSLKPETMRALLRFLGVEITALAETFGVSHQYFHQVINRERPDRRIQDLIAERLHMNADRIWGRKPSAAA